MAYLQMLGATGRSQAEAFCRSWSESPPRSATATVEAIESATAVARAIFLIIEVLHYFPVAG
jgi:hypothetical protein